MNGITDLADARGSAGDEHDLASQVLLPQRFHQRPHEQLHRYRERGVYQDDDCGRDMHHHAMESKIKIHEGQGRREDDDAVRLPGVSPCNTYTRSCRT